MGRDVGGQVLTVDQLGDDEGVGRVELGVEHPGHRRVAHALQRSDLTCQPFAGRTVDEVLVQQLQGHHAAVRVANAVDRSHPPSPTGPITR